MDPASLTLTILKVCKPTFYLLLGTALKPVANKGNATDIRGQIRRELTTKFNGLASVDNTLTFLKAALDIFDLGKDQLYEDSALLPLPADLQMRYEDIKKLMSGIKLEVSNFSNFDETSLDANFGLFMEGLMGKIYPQLHVNALAHVSNQTMAKNIANILQDSYPHFRWSVIVLDDKNLLRQRHHVKMRVQTFGTSAIENRHLPGTILRESCVTLPGLGNYGQFLCYKEEPHSSKTALELWADPEVAFSPDMVRQFLQLKEKWIQKWVKTNPHERSDMKLKDALLFAVDLLNIASKRLMQRSKHGFNSVEFNSVEKSEIKQCFEHRSCD